MSIGSVNIHHETEYKIELEWKIENFLSYLKNTFVELSPSFMWSSTDWSLQIEYDAEVKEIALALSKCGKPIAVKFDFGIKLIDETTEVRCTLTRHLRNSKDNFGTHEFVVESELIDRKQELLPAGVLIISCSITHLDASFKFPNVEYKNLDVLSSNFKTLYGCTKTSDMVVIVGNQRYYVHKDILAARSDVFAAMFEHDMEEKKSGITKILDCESTSFEDFLLYLYTGKVEKFSSENVYHLYKYADKYNVHDLKILCVRYMKRNISTANLFDIYILAHQFNEEKLISVVQDVFNRNALEIAKGDGWEQFLKENFQIANQLLINVLENIKLEY